MSTDLRDIKEETIWTFQGDTPVRDPKVIICLVCLMNHKVGRVFAGSERSVREMRDVS